MKRTAYRRRWVVALVAGLAVLSLGAAVQAGPRSNEGAQEAGFIGIMMQDLTADIAKGLGLNTRHGVVVSDVVDGSPADEAGIQDGDVIIEYDGKQVRTPDALRSLVVKSRVGDTVKVKIARSDGTKVLTVVVGKRPGQQNDEEREEQAEREKEFSVRVPGDWRDWPNNVMAFFDPGRRLGVHVVDLNEDLAGYFDVGKDGGVLVVDVERKSTATRAGIKAGDVIEEIGGEKVNSVSELKDAIKAIDPGEDFEIVVLRHGKPMTLTGEFEKNVEKEVFLMQNDKSRQESKEMEDLRKEMDQLKTEMQKLREELKKGLKDKI